MPAQACLIGRLLVNRSPPFALAKARDNFCTGFQGRALLARRTVPALAGSVKDRDALREFVRRRAGGRRELRESAGLLDFGAAACP